jgi:vacuolar-type H+-ATPase subunit H
MFAARDRTADILGNRFMVVKNGLDEGEVSAALTSLTERNRGLVRELERLQAAVGTDLRVDGSGSSDPVPGAAARNQVAGIAAEAEERAEETVQEKMALAEHRAEEVLRAAEVSAEASKAEARREAGDIIADARRRIESAEGQASYMLREAEAQVESAGAVAEEEAGKLVAEMRRKAEQMVQARIAKAEEEGRNIIERAISTAEAEAQRIREDAEQTRPANKKPREEQTGEGFDLLREDGSAGSSDGAMKESVEGGEGQVASAEDSALYEGTVDLAIRPPIVLDRIVKLHRHLKKTPQIKVTDVRRSDDRGLRMRLLLPKRTPLLEVLKAFPEVKTVAVPRQEAIPRPHGLQERDRPPVRRVFVTTRR